MGGVLGNVLAKRSMAARCVRVLLRLSHGMRLRFYTPRLPRVSHAGPPVRQSNCLPNGWCIFWFTRLIVHPTGSKIIQLINRPSIVFGAFFHGAESIVARFFPERLDPFSILTPPITLINLKAEQNTRQVHEGVLDKPKVCIDRVVAHLAFISHVAHGTARRSVKIVQSIRFQKMQSTSY